MMHCYTKPEAPDDPVLDAYEDYLNACDADDVEPLEFEDWQARRRDIASRVDEERAVAVWEDRRGR